AREAADPLLDALCATGEVESFHRHGYSLHARPRFPFRCGVSCRTVRCSATPHASHLVKQGPRGAVLLRIAPGDYRLTLSPQPTTKERSVCPCLQARG